ncbi:hypothetical protein L208DRAFT_1417685 [Tricholoma matsutake]|nr:hypothetical protein L208DRAFT_1417685 [Tricholoma matsutake 945]
MCYGGSYLLEAVQSFHQEGKAVGSPQDELKLYLETIANDDVIGNGLEIRCDKSHATTLPSNPIGTSFRQWWNHRYCPQKSTDIFEALQILKSAYCKQHLAAVHQAAGLVASALIAALDEVDYSSDKKE